MRAHLLQSRRAGSILPLVVISFLALFGLTALAVDLGMLAVAKTQCQNAADSAALAGVRSIDGSTNPDLATATNNAKNAVSVNKVLAQAVPAGNVDVRHGAYHYDGTSQTFVPQFPPTAPDNYNVTEVTVNYQQRTAFASFRVPWADAFGITALPVSATATAAHRPRDICIILDFSGSMNNESDLWNTEGYLGSVNNTSNNTDPIFLQFGWYDPTYSPLAKLQCTSSDPRVGKCNVTQAVLGIPALVNDFYQHARGSSAIQAFGPAPGGITTTSPGGDKHLKKQNTTTPAKNWQEITGSASTKFKGYADPVQGNGSWSGYTQGPGYWGMTFFAWPPDPDAAKDWRKRFFLKTGGSYPNFGGPIDNNTKLWDASGVWRDPPGNYVINYKAILAWIQANGVQGTALDGKPFPTQLRAGRILYYNLIPTDVPSNAYNHTQANSQITDPNQRFWKEYIDYVLGVWRDPFGNIQRPGNPSCSYGSDFTPGSSTGGSGINISGPDGSQSTWVAQVGSNNVPYINPLDNPKRPRHRFWFGPMTMVQFTSDTGLLPGPAHDISLYPAKLGIANALADIRNNHPNDLVSMILFNRPNYTGEPIVAGSFTQAQYNLSRDYSGMTNALWYPPNSGINDIRVFDANDVQTPRAHGDYCANTATMHGFVVAYNQFSENATLRSSQAGGFGRRGVQRLVILETDGMANVNDNVANGMSNGGPYNSYYRILPGDVVYPTGYTQAGAMAVVNQLTALDSANPPGYATPRKPVIIHAIAFGAIFEPTASGTEQTNAVNFLQAISAAGETIFPSSSSDARYGYKWVIGTMDERKAKMQAAFRKIMDDGEAIAIVK